MNKFDSQVKKELQTYLNDHVKLSNQDLIKIQEGILKKKKTYNIVNIAAILLLFIAISISTLSLIQPNPNLESTPSPFSSKQNGEKDLPTLDKEDKLPDEHEQQGVVKDKENEDEGKEIDPTETEKEIEDKFMELLGKYNKLKDYDFKYDGDITARNNYGNLGHKVKGFNTLEDFSTQFSEIATPAAVSKIFHLLFEEGNGLYLIEGEHRMYEFKSDHPYDLEKSSDNQFYLNQTYQDNLLRYSIYFEFTSISGKWLITDWSSTTEDAITKNQLLPEIENLMSHFLLMEFRAEFRQDNIDYLSDGREAHRILNAKSKTEFYSLFDDITTLEILKYIWEDYLVEESGKLYLLKAQRYYAGFFEAFDYQYKKITDGVYEINQSYFLEGDNSSYEVYFKVELVNNSTWKVTDYYFSKD